MNDNKITFVNDAGEEEDFYIVEQTTIGGANYLLVEQDAEDDDDGSFLILKENDSLSEDEMAAFDIVEDEKEIKLVAEIFNELLEDVDLEV